MSFQRSSTVLNSNICFDTELDFRLMIHTVLSMPQKQARYRHVHVDGQRETQREKLRIVVQREESTRESHRPCPTFHHSSPSRSLSSSLLGGISEKQPVSRVQAILYIQCCSLLIQSFPPVPMEGSRNSGFTADTNSQDSHKTATEPINNYIQA